MGSKPEIDEDTIRKAIAGDERACHRFVERYTSVTVNSVARVLGREHSDVRDVCQHAFDNAFRAIRNGSFTIGGKAKISTWLARVAFNAAVDRRRALEVEVRARDSRAAEAIAGALHPPPTTPEDVYGRAEEMRFARAFVAGLPSIHRSIIELRLTEEDDLAIAEKLHTTVENMRVRWIRALDFVRNISHGSKKRS